MLVLEHDVLVLGLLNIEISLVSPVSDASPDWECCTLIVCILGCCVRPTPESYPVAEAVFGLGFEIGAFKASWASVVMLSPCSSCAASRSPWLLAREGIPCSIWYASKEQENLIFDSSSGDISCRLINGDGRLGGEGVSTKS